MAEYLIQDTTLTGIADAIRSKTGGTDPIPVSEMASTISTLETGGGGVTVPCVLFYLSDATATRSSYNSATTTYAVVKYAFLTKGSNLLWACFDGALVNTTTASNAQSASVKPIPVDISTLTITNGSSYDNVRAAENIRVSYGYRLEGAVFLVGYTVPGLYIKISTDDVYTVFADSSCEDYYTQTSGVYGFTMPVHEVDFSESSITALYAYEFRLLPNLHTIRLPATLTSIASYAIMNCTSLTTLDFSKCTSVPTLATSAFTSMASGYEIKVPAALYDEWIAATNWSSLADHIVAV